MQQSDDQKDPATESSPPDEWDQAALARDLASQKSPRLKHSKRQKKTRPSWDSSTAKNTRPLGEDLDQKLQALENDFKERSPRRRSNSSRKRPESSNSRGKRTTAWLLAAALASLVTYFGYIAIRPASDRPTIRSKARPGNHAEVLPALLPKDPSAGVPSETPPQYRIVGSSDPDFDSVKQTISEFLTTKSSERRLELVRPTPDVRAHLEASSDHPALQLQLAPTFGSAFIISGNFVYAEILEAGIGSRGVVLEKTGDDYLIDFDSFVGFSKADWGAIANLQFDTAITTRALMRVIPGSESPIPGTDLVYITDPQQNHSFTAVVSLLGVKDRHIFGVLSTGQLLPFVIRLNRIEHGGTPRLVVEDVLYSGWFEENLFR